MFPFGLLLYYTNIQLIFLKFLFILETSSTYLTLIYFFSYLNITATMCFLFYLVVLCSARGLFNWIINYIRFIFLFFFFLIFFSSSIYFFSYPLPLLFFFSSIFFMYIHNILHIRIKK